MEDDPLSQLQPPPPPLARVVGLFVRVWTRVVSPAGVRLMAPVLAVIVIYTLWRFWRLAGRSALGRALRWHTVFTVAAVAAGLMIYVLAMAPDDPTEAATARALAAEEVGRPVYPEPVVVVGAFVLAVTTFSALRAAWRWRTPPRDHAVVGEEWRRWRAGTGRRLGAGAVALTGGALAVGLALIGAGNLAAAALPEKGSRGTLWVGTPRGAARLTASGWEPIRRPAAPLPSNIVNDVAAGPRGEVWLATDGGLLRIDSDGGFQRIVVENAPLPYPTVLGLAVDRRGIAWAATGAGAAGVDVRGDGRAFSSRNAPLMHQLLDAAAVDRDGLVWFGGAGGVNVYEPAADWSSPGRWPVGFNRVTTGGGLPGNLVYAILQDSRGRMWFGTSGGAAAFSPDPAAHALGADQPARWTTLTAASGLANEKVHAIAEDVAGRIYFGTEQGVSIYEESQSGAARWLAIAPERLPHPHVEALAISPDGRVWIGTRGGLAVLDPRATSGPQLPVYRSHPLRRWTGLLWPPHSRQDLPADEITSLEWIP